MTPDAPILWLVAAAGLLVCLALFRGIGVCSVAMAQQLVDRRREEEAQRRLANAAAEAAGRAASLEPLNLNADGTVEEPIIGVVENR